MTTSTCNCALPRAALPAVLAGVGLLALPALSQAQTASFSNVADRSAAAPGKNGNFNAFGLPAVRGANVAFYGVFNNFNSYGIYTGTAGSTPLNRVADTITTTVPGQSGNFTFLFDPAISGTNVAFLAGYANFGSGVYTGTVGGSALNRVADGTTAVPGQTSGNFTSFGNAPAISGNNVAFSGSYSNGSGIYTGTLGIAALSLVADTTTAVPGQSGTFSGFGDPAVSGNNLAFRGTFNNSNSAGLFLELGGGSLLNVINVGDPLFGSTVRSLDFGPFGLDGTTLTFGYSLNNTLQGVAVASFGAVPEPATWALLLIGGAGVLGLVRRSRWA